MRRPIAAALALAVLAAGAQAQVADLRSTSALRVCADPAASPMSSEDGSGFENRLAELLAAKLNLPLEYFWFPQGMGCLLYTSPSPRD